MQKYLHPQLNNSLILQIQKIKEWIQLILMIIFWHNLNGKTLSVIKKNQSKKHIKKLYG